MEKITKTPEHKTKRGIYSNIEFWEKCYKEDPKRPLVKEFLEAAKSTDPGAMAKVLYKSKKRTIMNLYKVSQDSPDYPFSWQVGRAEEKSTKEEEEKSTKEKPKYISRDDIVWDWKESNK